MSDDAMNCIVHVVE